MNSKKELKKTSLTGSHQINTEKLYLFRRICEKAYKEKFGTFYKSLKQIFSNYVPRWDDIQMGLALVEIYEESSIEDLKKQNEGKDLGLHHKIWSIKKAPPSHRWRDWNKLIKHNKNKNER